MDSKKNETSGIDGKGKEVRANGKADKYLGFYWKMME